MDAVQNLDFYLWKKSSVYRYEEGWRLSCKKARSLNTIDDHNCFLRSASMGYSETPIISNDAKLAHIIFKTIGKIYLQILSILLIHGLIKTVATINVFALRILSLARTNVLGKSM